MTKTSQVKENPGTGKTPV